MNELTNIYLDGSYKNKNPTWHIEDSEDKAKSYLKQLLGQALSQNQWWKLDAGR